MDNHRQTFNPHEKSPMDGSFDEEQDQIDMIEGQPKVNIKTQHAQATPEMLAQADLSNEMLMNSGDYPPTHELQDFSKFSHNETTIDDQYDHFQPVNN